MPDWTSAEACGARQPARKARGATQSDEFGHGVQGSTQPDEFGHGVQSSIVHSKQLAARRRTRELMHRLTALTLPPRAWRHFDLYDLRNENRIARISRRSVRARSAARGHRFQRNAGKATASSEAGGEFASIHLQMRALGDPGKECCPGELRSVSSARTSMQSRVRRTRIPVLRVTSCSSAERGGRPILGFVGLVNLSDLGM